MIEFRNFGKGLLRVNFVVIYVSGYFVVLDVRVEFRDSRVFILMMKYWLGIIKTI